MRTQAAVLAVALFACPFAVATPHAIETVRLRIGVVPYDDPAQSTQWKDTDDSLNAYFAEVERIANHGVHYEISIVHGNYYQVLEWMRQGKIDGAIEPPFSAFLLTHDPKLELIPVAEFIRNTDASGGGTVFVTADKTKRAPLAALHDCLTAVGKSLNDPQPVQQCELAFVNHLSTTGFVLPLLYISKHLEEFGVKPKQEQAYWERLLEWSRFTLWHARVHSPKGVPTFSFSYTKSENALPLDVPRLNDALLISKRALRNGNADNVWITAGSVMKTKDNWRGYKAIAPWNQSVRDRFSKAIEPLYPGKSDAPLSTILHSWYDEKKYTFTIDETISLLTHDQVIRGDHNADLVNAALVLPGGGVRATYQSVILDSLYSRTIANTGDPYAAARKDDPGEKRLLIKYVTGTSGGALLGYFAAHRNGMQSSELTDHWIDHAGTVRTTPTSIFPTFSVFRCLSLLLVIAIFAITAAIHLPGLRVAPTGQVPFWYTTLLAAVVIAAPFFIWREARQNPAYVPVYEGLCYFAVLLVAHFFHSVSLPKENVPPGKRLYIGVAMIAIGGLLLLRLLVAPLKSPAASAALSAGLLILIIGGLAMAVSASGTVVRFKRMLGYAEGLLVLLALIGGTLLFFAAGLAAGQVTTLEMTSAYWIWTFVAAAFASNLIVIAGKLYPKGPLEYGISFLASPSGTAPFPYTPTWTLAGWGCAGLAIWLVFIAPALYSSTTGREYFDHARTALSGKRSFAPLLVSMTAFGTQVRDYQPYKPGDYYACLTCDGVNPSQPSAAAKFLHITKDKDFQDAVFASGSPFPIFPAVTVQEDAKPHPGLFVDGGYAHRVPIEAAVLANASQILVVENIAYREEELGQRPSVGTLSANLGKAFSFLFDRAQELDVQAGQFAVVATIYPNWKDPDPFLMDFRAPIVKMLQREALRDLNGHRVGRIKSWGLPADMERR